MNRPECPGPCNPRNKSCRKTCLQNVLTLLEELPPCIRMRLCQEDLAAVFGKDVHHEREQGYRDVSTMSEDLADEERQRIADEDKLAEISEEETREEESKKESKEEESVPTTEDKRIQTESTGYEAFSLRIRTVSARARYIVAFGSRMLGHEDCSCRIINFAIYVGIFFLLTAFARHTSGYQFFLSSQICGLIAILTWRISGTVPL